MHRTLRRPLLALAAPLLLAVALPWAANAATPTYQNEAQHEFESQLAHHEIASAVFNRQIRSLRLTLKDGRHFRYRYPRKTEPTLAAEMRAKGVPVTVLTAAEAKKELPKKHVHHKIRYIAGGILIAVIVIVGAVLLVNRRRKAALD
jgi:hypothetical protein